MARLIKYTLLITNVIIFISGLIMLIAGSVVQGQINSQNLSRTIGGYSTQAGSIICIIFGIVVMIISALGLYAAMKDQHRFLILFSSIMALVFLIQFVTGVVGLGVKNSSKFEGYVSDVFSFEFKFDNKEPINTERDFFQKTFTCCGWNGPDDYKKEDLSIEAPESCCKEPKCKTTNKEALFSDGCKTRITNESRRVINVACGILVTFAIFNAFGILLSAWHVYNIRSGYQYS